MEHRRELAFAPLDEHRTPVRAVRAQADLVHLAEELFDPQRCQAIAGANHSMASGAGEERLDRLPHRRRLADVAKLVEQIEDQRLETRLAELRWPRLHEPG